MMSDCTVLCAEVIWKIDNFSCCWHEQNEVLFSDDFFLDSLHQTTWNLGVFPNSGHTEEIELGLLQNGDEDVVVKFQLSILNRDGSSQHECKPQIFSYGFPQNSVKQYLLQDKTNCNLNGDVFTFCCKMWKKDNGQPQDLCKFYLQTTIPVQKCLFDWSISTKSYNEKIVRFDKLFHYGKWLKITLSYVPDGCNRLKIHCVGNFSETLDLKCNFQTVKTKENFLISHTKISKCPIRVVLKPVISWKKITESQHRYQSKYSSLDLICELSIVGNRADHFLRTISVSKPTEQQCMTQSSLPWNISDEKQLPYTAETKSSNLLKNDMLQMYREELMSDFSLQVDSKVFPAHSLILAARSPVFRQMLNTDMTEKRDKILKLDDLDEDTVQKLLDWIYTDSSGELCVDSALKLYYAADKYQILGLKEESSEFLKKNISVSNVCEVLLLSDRHNDENLKASVIEFISRHEKEVVCSEEFKNFCGKNLQLSVVILLQLSQIRLM